MALDTLRLRARTKLIGSTQGVFPIFFFARKKNTRHQRNVVGHGVQRLAKIQGTVKEQRRFPPREATVS